MARRSPRLEEMGYYDEDENPCICYSDTGRRRLNISTNMRRHSFPLEARKAANVIYVSGPAVQPRSWFSLAWVKIWLLLAGLVVSWLAMAMATDGEVQQLQHQVKHLHQLKEEVDHLREQLQQHKAMVRAPLANFALCHHGARVMTAETSKTHKQKNGPPWLRPLGPNTVIKGHNYPLIPGQCWAFTGQTGKLSITLPLEIHITKVTVGHIVKEQSLTGTIQSAPKSFSVYGLKDFGPTEIKLGTFLYDADGDSFQTFDILEQHKGETFRSVRLEIHDNHGHDAFTCVYSFRVHVEIPDSSTTTSTQSTYSWFGRIGHHFHQSAKALYNLMSFTQRLPPMTQDALTEPEMQAETVPHVTEI
ncbi:unnamed protein product [Knipowitschia caucasica]